jgi:hypothetical protein
MGGKPPRPPKEWTPVSARTDTQPPANPDGVHAAA